MFGLRWSILLMVNTLAAAQLLHMGYFIVVRHIECTTNTRYITEMACHPVLPRNRSVHAELQLMKQITNLTSNMELSIPKKKKMQKIYELTFELCKVLRERKRKTLIELLSAMTCLGNKVIRCPIHTGHYLARNITLAEVLPPALTESEFHLRINWYMPRVASVLNITVLGHLYEISKERQRKKKYL